MKKKTIWKRYENSSSKKNWYFLWPITNRFSCHIAFQLYKMFWLSDNHYSNIEGLTS